MAESKQATPLIIDTDPGIDDSMAIACAFNSPEVEVIGLTSIFGNVQTPKATQNCFFLLELAGRPEVGESLSHCLCNICMPVNLFLLGAVLQIL